MPALLPKANNFCVLRFAEFPAELAESAVLIKTFREVCGICGKLICVNLWLIPHVDLFIFFPNTVVNRMVFLRIAGILAYRKRTGKSRME